ncbi:MAG TPA: 16S rRNA (uracil(1498)-N(3))-methyltransferase [Mollicutes bacterium]|nr:16S rRNA (uracil(1498)-N(3))-methyltransferase [Mollicutes bacterium]
MQRYFALNEKLELSSSDIYHMYKVMRMKENDKIEVIYDEVVYLCEITTLSVNSVKLKVLNKKITEDESSVKVTIAISLVKEQKWDFILQKTTELGVSQIIPLSLSRTLIKLDNNKYNKKCERWNKICKEAAEQSHRVTIPNISKQMNINDLVKLDYDLKIVCSTTDVNQNLKQVLSKHKRYDRILVVIGPEGGISPAEEELLATNGFIKTSLGKCILRVETAPLFVMSAINYELMR